MRPTYSRETMSVFQLIAMVGLLGLVGGVFLVNKSVAPHALLAGISIAAFGVAMLVVVAIRQLFV
jgi:hypothetical protein